VPIGITCIDNKLKPKRLNKTKQQAEFDMMERYPSKSALDKLKEKPYQLKCQKMRKQYETNA
jgi:hypothetical protein